MVGLPLHCKVFKRNIHFVHEERKKHILIAKMSLLAEYQVVLPYVSLAELNIALLYTLCINSLAETGGGEGIEVIVQEPLNDPEIGKGYYYHKMLHLSSKVPRTLRILAPRGTLEVKSETENIFPEIHTVYTNPEYMKDKFIHDMLTIAIDNDKATHDNVFGLDAARLAKRKIIPIDIVNDPVPAVDYKLETDPSKCPLTGSPSLTANWKDTAPKYLTVYMLVETEFVWWGLQTTVQKMIQDATTRITRNFYRSLFCNLDKTRDLTIEDIRVLEAETKEVLNVLRATGEVTGMSVKG